MAPPTATCWTKKFTVSLKLWYYPLFIVVNLSDQLGSMVHM